MKWVGLIAVLVLVALAGVAVGYLIHDPGTEVTVIRKVRPADPCASLNVYERAAEGCRP